MEQKYQDLEFGGGQLVPAMNPRSLARVGAMKKSVEYLLRNAPRIAGTYAKAKFRKLNPVNVAAAAAAIGVGRKMMDTSTDPAANLQLIPLTNAAKGKPRSRERKKGKYTKQLPAKQYKMMSDLVKRIIYPPKNARYERFYQMNCTYNEQIFNEIPIGMNGAILTDFYTLVGSTGGNLNNQLDINFARADIEITNHSPTRTYLELYFVQCIDDADRNPLDCFSTDVTNGIITTALTNPVTKFEDGRLVRNFYKTIKTQKYTMDSNAIVNTSIKLPTGLFDDSVSILNPANWGQGSPVYFVKKWTVYLFVRSYSQIIKNSTNNDFVIDNNQLGFRVSQEFKVSRALRDTYSGIGASTQYKTAATPQIWTGTTLQNS